MKHPHTEYKVTEDLCSLFLWSVHWRSPFDSLDKPARRQTFRAGRSQDAEQMLRRKHPNAERVEVYKCYPRG